MRTKFALLSTKLSASKYRNKEAGRARDWMTLMGYNFGMKVVRRWQRKGLGRNFGFVDMVDPFDRSVLKPVLSLDFPLIWASKFTL